MASMLALDSRERSPVGAKWGWPEYAPQERSRRHGGRAIPAVSGRLGLPFAGRQQPGRKPATSRTFAQVSQAEDIPAELQHGRVSWLGESTPCQARSPDGSSSVSAGDVNLH